MSLRSFQLFELNAEFPIDLELLQQRHRRLQQVLHPDRFVNDTPGARGEAVRRSAELNDAYQSLCDPVERGRILLQQRGWDWPDTQATVSDPKLLLEQLELRETLAAIAGKLKTGPGGGLAGSELGAFITLLNDMREQQLGQLADMFRTLASAETIYLGLMRLRFLHRLRSECRRLEDQYDLW